MARRLNSSASLNNRESLLSCLIEFVTCPFVWVWAKVQSIRGVPRNLPEIEAGHRYAEVPQSSFISEPVEGLDLFSSSRITQGSFLFLGLGGSGITRTAASLFEFAQEDSTGTDARDLKIRDISKRLIYPSQIKSHQVQSNTMDLRVIDVPGLCKESYLEEDAEIITASKNYLKESLPNQIPTVTFIITQFDDNRFEGEASQFSKMLTALSYSRNFWTDFKLSNVSLVLTHSSKIDSSEVLNKISRFQDAFCKVYSNTPHIDCTVVDLEDLGNTKVQLISTISRIASRRHELNNVIADFLAFLKPGFKNVEIQSPENRLIPLKSLLPSSSRSVNELLDLLLQGKVGGPENYSDNSDHSDDEVRFGPFLVEYFPDKSKSMNSSPISILPPHTKVMLFDRQTQLDVQSLRVGDKLADKDLHSNVVTSIKMIQTSSNDYKGHPVGLIHVEVREDDNEDELSYNPIVLRYQNGKIRHVELKRSAIPHESRKFFILELDNTNGTYIADGHVVYAQFNSTL